MPTTQNETPLSSKAALERLEQFRCPSEFETLFTALIISSPEGKDFAVSKMQTMRNHSLVDHLMSNEGRTSFVESVDKHLSDEAKARFFVQPKVIAICFAYRSYGGDPVEDKRLTTMFKILHELHPDDREAAVKQPGAFPAIFDKDPRAGYELVQTFPLAVRGDLLPLYLPYVVWYDMKKVKADFDDLQSAQRASVAELVATSPGLKDYRRSNNGHFNTLYDHIVSTIQPPHSNGSLLPGVDRPIREAKPAEFAETT